MRRRATDSAVDRHGYQLTDGWFCIFVFFGGSICNVSELMASLLLEKKKKTTCVEIFPIRFL
jgi:hypothetical protein